jgi:hypothetical protein
MRVVECDFPAKSALDQQTIDASYFQDSYRAPLRKPQVSMIDIFFDLFGHHPGWVKALLLTRNRIASAFGLDVPGDASVMHPTRRGSYRVGETIGPWPIFHLSEHELVAGRDNKHLNFRLSLLREIDGQPTVVVSTICHVHNLAGKLYLLFIVPFHKWGVKHMISAAINCGRI